jgi:hypothetical protein
VRGVGALLGGSGAAASRISMLAPRDGGAGVASFISALWRNGVASLATSDGSRLPGYDCSGFQPLSSRSGPVAVHACMHFSSPTCQPGDTPGGAAGATARPLLPLAEAGAGDEAFVEVVASHEGVPDDEGDEGASDKGTAAATERIDVLAAGAVAGCCECAPLLLPRGCDMVRPPTKVWRPWTKWRARLPVRLRRLPDGDVGSAPLACSAALDGAVLAAVLAAALLLLAASLRKERPLAKLRALLLVPGRRGMAATNEAREPALSCVRGRLGMAGCWWMVVVSAQGAARRPGLERAFAVGRGAAERRESAPHAASLRCRPLSLLAFVPCGALGTRSCRAAPGRSLSTQRTRAACSAAPLPEHSTDVHAARRRCRA